MTEQEYITDVRKVAISVRPEERIDGIGDRVDLMHVFARPQALHEKAFVQTGEFQLVELVVDYLLRRFLVFDFK